MQDILEWTIGRHGDAQAERFANQLIARLEALAAGQPLHPRPCSALLSEGRRAPGLGYVREGRHYPHSPRDGDGHRAGRSLP
ncbi:hypothetical protein [Poseidonocella sp. HB161398]|uniref:hypothetical protein n=1 Tax=Poseidonocella sp. HB161398 TaxID=2320855 RepID=UPI003513C7EB